MDDNTVEKIFSIGVEVGVINLASKLGLIEENISEKQAHTMFGKRQVNEWRKKRWIVAYPSGNKTRAKYYYKRSELETASRMLDFQNIIPPNKLTQFIDRNISK